MSREELLAYMTATFATDLEKIKEVVLYADNQVPDTDSLTYIPHHRRKIYLSKDGVIHIAPSEGLLRVEHLQLQVECLASLLKKPIPCKVIGKYIFSEKAQEFIDLLDAKRLQGRSVDGLVIGSLWNINYIINRRLHSAQMQSVFKAMDKKELGEYIEFRARQSALEQASLTDGIILNKSELATFREGAIPSKDEQDIVNSLYEKMASKKIARYRDNFLNNDEAKEYAALDFIFFKDLVENTQIFDSTLVSEESAIYSDKGITYQLISLENGMLLNIGWIHPELLGELVRQLHNRYNLKSLHMYGKCGAIGDAPLGSIVTPWQTQWNDHMIPIQNKLQNLDGTTPANFCCVPSPLIETMSWGKLMRSRDVECVEMELYEVGRNLSQSIESFIVYYISDRPFDNYKIGQRWTFLEQKLKCTNILVDSIFNLYTHRHPQISPGP
ncbi:MAG TPA: hypothetical protein PKA29_00735 [Candidatus Saccharibacteria bacterium]|nr:hypothetical protein [Candidatus Saccharibacteria bacterium]